MINQRRKIPISPHAAKYTQDLRANYTDRAFGRHGSNVRGSIELGFLRGYQAGYEDCLMKKPPEHYARSKKQIREDDDD